MIRNVLFLTESREDYLADSLLHGLISLGLEVIDYPRKHVLYAGCQVSPATPTVGIRGHGFTLYGLLEDRDVDRSFTIQRLESGWFDLVVIGQIWRQWGQLLDLAPLLQNVPVVLLDGDDDVRLFHRSGTRIRRYGWQPFPIRSGLCFYFKREWAVETMNCSHCKVMPVNFSIPADKIRPVNIEGKCQYLATHCVDIEVAKACDLHSSYAFASEDDYYDDLSASLFAVTTKRGGWDCLRHYEIAAAGALPCIKQLEAKPISCAPHGLRPGVNCISYQDWSDLESQLSTLSANKPYYKRLLYASSVWVRTHTTTSAAQRLLNTVTRR